MKTFKSEFAFKSFIILIAWLFISGCEKDPFNADSGTFTDKRDGNEYKWVKIGEQIWMAENLAYLPVAPCAPNSQCGVLVYGYEGEGSYGTNYSIYGCLYDWETAQKVCPEGWHLPSDEEWMELEQFLGMPLKELDRSGFRGEEKNIGGMLKETGFDYWNSPNTGATNEVSFCARAGGLYHERFSYFKDIGSYWTNSKIPGEELAFGRALYSNYKGIMRSIGSLNDYYSIRCIKN